MDLLFLHSQGCRIRSSLQYPNNDGIHINSSRDVTIRDCDITTGDDAVIVRANNASLPENRVCERVSVRNCRITSWSAGIRVGWINDGTIRSCSFSDIEMSDTTVGIGIMLPGRGAERLLDEGREATLIEDLSFERIRMDGIYAHPVLISVSEKDCTRLEAIRNVRFRDVRARGLEFFRLAGKKENHLRDITFTDCVFEKVSDEELPGWRFHGAKDRRKGAPVRNADRVILNGTVLTAAEDSGTEGEKIIRKG